MQLIEIRYWKAVHFNDGRVITPDDKLWLSGGQIKMLLDLQVEPMKRKGHYKVIE